MISVTLCYRRRWYTQQKRRGFATFSTCCCWGSGRWCWSELLVPVRLFWSMTEWTVWRRTTTWSPTFLSTSTPLPRYCSTWWRDHSRRRLDETTVRRELKISSTSLMIWTCQRYRLAVFIARQHTDARYWYSNSVRPSVCPWHAGIVRKRLNISS